MNSKIIFKIRNKEEIIKIIIESKILSSKELLFLEENNIKIENVLSNEFNFSFLDSNLNYLFLIKMKIIIFIQNNFENECLEFYCIINKNNELKSKTFEKFLIDIDDVTSSHYLFFAYLKNGIELKENETIGTILEFLFEIFNWNYLIDSKKSETFLNDKEFYFNISDDFIKLFKNFDDFIFFYFLLVKNNFLILKDKQVYITKKFYNLNLNFWTFFRHQNIINLMNTLFSLNYNHKLEAKSKIQTLIEKDILKCNKNCFIHKILNIKKITNLDYISNNNFIEKKSYIFSLEKFINTCSYKDQFWSKQKYLKNMSIQEKIDFFNNFFKNPRKFSNSSFYKIQQAIKFNFPVLKEIKYLKYVSYYKIDFETFKIETNLNTKEWNYLKILSDKSIQKKEIIDFLNDYKYELKKETINYIITNNKFYFDGYEFKKINRVKIIDNILKKEQRQMKIEEIYEKVFFKKDISLRNLESYVDRSNYCIRSINKKARYYDYSLIDNKALKCLEKTIIRLKGFYNTKFIFEGNLELMKKLNLEDYYELHNLIKNKILNNNITLLRMPNILINCNSKEEFIVKLSSKNKINDFNQLVDYLSINYGHDKMSLKSNLDIEKIEEIKNIQFKNINKSIEINKKDLQIFENVFFKAFNDSDFIGTKEYFRFLDLNHYDKNFFNNSILEKMGYEISDNFLYIQKKDSNLFYKIREQLLNVGIYKNEYKDFFTNNLESIFQNDFLRQNIIQINEDTIVSYKYFLERTKIDLEVELSKIEKEISSILRKQKYFSFRKLRHFSLFNGFLSNEYCLKFISRKLKNIKYDKLENELILRDRKSTRFIDYLVDFIKEQKYLKYDDLIIKIEDEILDKNILNIWKETGIISRIASSQELSMFFKDNNTKIKYLQETYIKFKKES